MRYARPLDFDKFKPDAYSGQFLYVGESCFVVLSRVPAGKTGPPLHTHNSDQLYYTLQGEMHVQLGPEQLVVPPHNLVFIPAGVPHRNWNEGTEATVHLEMIAPGPHPLEPIMTPVESTDIGPGGYYVRPADEAKMGTPQAMPSGLDPTSASPTFRIQVLAERSSGSEHALVYTGIVDPDSGGPTTHIHEFDQFYFVLEGQLSVEVALESHVVDPYSLVVLPAGVPHRQWNAGPGRERHLAFNVPEPLEGAEWDCAVHFGAREKTETPT